MRQEVTHRWGVTASSLKRSSLSTGGWVGGKLTSPAPIYDITLYLIKGSESALNSSLISERYRKEIVRERAREILCRSVEVRREGNVCWRSYAWPRTQGLLHDEQPHWLGVPLTPSHSTGSACQPYRTCWFKRGKFLAPSDDNQRGQKAPSQLNADWHQSINPMNLVNRFPSDSILPMVLYSKTAQKHPHQCKQLKFQGLQQELHLCPLMWEKHPIHTCGLTLE